MSSQITTRFTAETPPPTSRHRGIKEVIGRVVELTKEFKVMNSSSFATNVETIVNEHPDPQRQLPALTVALMLEVKQQYQLEGNMKKALVMAIVDLLILRFSPDAVHAVLHDVADSLIETAFALSADKFKLGVLEKLKCRCCCGGGGDK